MPGPSPKWINQLSFSTRLSNIINISKRLEQEATSRLDSPLARARETENQILQSAASIEDYQKRCTAAAFYIASGRSPEVGPLADEVKSPLSPAATTIGQYKHAQHHRNGLFSEVFKAPSTPQLENDSQSLGYIALKVTTPSTMIKPHDSEKEARILKSISSCKEVTPLLDSFWTTGGRYVIVFPFLPHDFDTLLKRRLLSKQQIKAHLRDLFKALSHLHSQNIIHRDIKPSNILLRSADGPALVSDFGIAWSAQDRALESAGDKITDVGTTCYRPPEILFGKRDYDSSLDMWSAGCTFAEAVKADTKPLFESGEVGTELALIQSIFMNLGTPSEQVWPSAPSCPDWGKMQWKQFPGRSWAELLPSATSAATDLVSKLVCFEQTQRYTADLALSHPFFANDNENLQ